MLMEHVKEALNGENSDGYVEVRRSKAEQGAPKEAGVSVGYHHADVLQFLGDCMHGWLTTAALAHMVRARRHRCT